MNISIIYLKINIGFQKLIFKILLNNFIFIFNSLNISKICTKFVSIDLSPIVKVK